MTQRKQKKVTSSQNRSRKEVKGHPGSDSRLRAAVQRHTKEKTDLRTERNSYALEFRRLTRVNRSLVDAVNDAFHDRDEDKERDN